MPSSPRAPIWPLHHEAEETRTAKAEVGALCSVLRGCDVDKPRNLAKTVTVE